MSYKLTESIKKAIRSDNDLMKDVADALKISISTLPQMITKNNRRLTDIAVLNVISEHTGITVENLYEEYAEENATEIVANEGAK